MQYSFTYYYKGYLDTAVQYKIWYEEWALETYRNQVLTFLVLVRCY